MGALRDDQRNLLYGLFQMKDFDQMYDVIHSEYKTKELGKNLSDEDRIAEYQWITQQLRKYMSSKQNQILDHGSDLDGMLAEVANLIGAASEYNSTRQGLIYNFLRDSWLLEVWNGISYLIEQVNESEAGYAE